MGPLNSTPRVKGQCWVLFMSLWLQTAVTAPGLALCGHTCHLQRVLQDLDTPNSGISPQFSLPLDNGAAPPKTPWHQRAAFHRESEPKPEVSGKLCIRDETEASVLLPVFHKGPIHHFFSPLLGSYQGFQSIFITPYRHLAR